MNKYIIAAVLAFTTVTATAGSSSNDAGSYGMVNVISKDVGFANLIGVTTDSAGRVLVCPKDSTYRWNDNTCTNDKGGNGWQFPENVVPRNRTYIGYQPVFGYGKVYSVVIYWK